MPDISGRRWSRRPKQHKGQADSSGGNRGFDVEIVIDIESAAGKVGGLDVSPSRQGDSGDRGDSASDANENVAGGRADRGLAKADDAPVPSVPPISAISGPVRVAQLVVGAASPDVEPRQIGSAFRSLPFRPDTVIDGWSTDAITVRGASLRGHFHRYNGAPRQDDFAVHAMPDGRVIAIVADGVSAATQSHLGSSTVVNYAAQWLQTQVPMETDQTDWTGLIKNTAWALNERARVLFKLSDPDATKAEQELATTITCAVVEQLDAGAYRAFIVGVGDSGAWILRDDQFQSVLGGKAEGEGGISSSAVAGLPRVPNEIAPSVVEFGPGDVLLLGTDGIGDPLGSGEGGVGNLFKELLSGTHPPSLVEFAHAVDFSRETFDDDRTLIAVIPHAPSQEGGDIES